MKPLTKTEILAIIPARGGSKGVPRKCLKDLAGKPLIAYTIEAALDSNLVTRVVVTTDDTEIAEVARNFGAEVPFLRPSFLAEDTTPTFPVVAHAVNFLMTEQGYKPDLLVLLQPTSPLRQATHIDEAITQLLVSGADSVVSICNAKDHPYWLKELQGDRVCDFLKAKPLVLRRQDLPQVYILNGAIYISRTDVIVNRQCLLGEDTRGYIMDEEHSVDIDTPLDFLLAEALIKERMKVADS